MLPRIEQAIRRNPLIFTKAPEVQLDQLIVSPCRSLDLQGLPHQLIIIDGLDECIGTADSDREQEQEIVLTLLLSLVSSNLPLTVLLCSRAEEWLKAAFQGEPLSPMTELLSLGWTAKADEDIWHYLNKEFERICARPRNRDSMRYFDKPWPPFHVYEVIVGKASGQYVFVTTAIRFIDDRWSVPWKQLEILMSSLKRPSAGPALFSSIDNLYLDILKSCPNANLMLEVLGEVICFDYTVKSVSDRWDVLDTLSQRSPGESYQALRGLHSVVDVENLNWSEKQPLFHASFFDFITSESRAGTYFIDLRLSHAQMLCKCIDRLHLIMHPTADIILQDPSIYAFYAWRHHHLPEAAITEPLLNRLSCFDFKQWFSIKSPQLPQRITALLQWVWGHGLFSFQQLESSPESQRERARSCTASFRSSYDEAMLVFLDQEASHTSNILKRLLDACFSESFESLSVVAVPDGGSAYYPSLSLAGEIIPVSLNDSYLMYWSENATPDIIPPTGSLSAGALEAHKRFDEETKPHVFTKDTLPMVPIVQQNFGIHLHVFFPSFLEFLADPQRSKHHCYITQDRIRWLLRNMLENPTGLPAILSVSVSWSQGHQEPAKAGGQYMYAQWFRVLCIFTELAVPGSHELGDILKHHGSAVLLALKNLGYTHMTKRFKVAAGRHLPDGYLLTCNL
ncbi:hypothetical protein D9611_000969 [Ephemerocybe angulata]|uniref:NACHT domain-containing protein n=1 Tax=Ephemerocybe angulata TaxID=980116 RepID=A0A8H5BNS1_9AGAR|nr:hypothetical protein D9611_000969 [Tulosesus angulatus]